MDQYETISTAIRTRTETHGLPMAGFIVAGFPSPAEEELLDVVSFDDYLVPRPQASFIVQVSGDSMTGAGILPGDLVIVEKGRAPKSGDIVVAEVDGETTMKYYRKEHGRIVLEAANPRYPAISPKVEMRLLGVVSACVRKYKL
jgi:repressor LexA